MFRVMKAGTIDAKSVAVQYSTEAFIASCYLDKGLINLSLIIEANNSFSYDR